MMLPLAITYLNFPHEQGVVALALWVLLQM